MTPIIRSVFYCITVRVQTPERSFQEKETPDGKNHRNQEISRESAESTLEQLERIWVKGGMTIEIL